MITLQVLVLTMIEFGFSVRDIQLSVETDYPVLFNTVPEGYHNLKHYIAKQYISMH